MRYNGVFYTLRGAIIALAFLLIAAYVGMPYVEIGILASRRKHQEDRVRHQLGQIAKALSVYASKNNGELPSFHEPVGAIRAIGPYMRHTCVKSGYRDHQDEWGNTLSFIPKTDCIIIRSVGPNKEDEGGGGDDIEYVLTLEGFVDHMATVE